MEGRDTEKQSKGAYQDESSLGLRDVDTIQDDANFSPPMTVLEPQNSTGKRSISRGIAWSRSAVTSSLIGSTGPRYAALTATSYSERNSSEKCAEETNARSQRNSSAPPTDLPVSKESKDRKSFTRRKQVLQPRKRDNQSAKIPFFDVPLNDDVSTSEEEQRLVTKASSKAGKCKLNGRESEVHYASPSSGLPSLEDGLSSTSRTSSDDDLEEKSERSRINLRRERKKKKKKRPGVSTDETMLNTSLVREINDEIDCLKRTFLSDAPNDGQQAELSVPNSTVDVPILPIPPPPTLIEPPEPSKVTNSNSVAELVDFDSRADAEVDADAVGNDRVIDASQLSTSIAAKNNASLSPASSAICLDSVEDAERKVLMQTVTNASTQLQPIGDGSECPDWQPAKSGSGTGTDECLAESRLNPFNDQLDSCVAHADLSVPCYMFCTHCGAVSVHQLVPASGKSPANAPAPAPVPVPEPLQRHLSSVPSLRPDSRHPPHCSCDHSQTECTVSETNKSASAGGSTAIAATATSNPNRASDTVTVTVLPMEEEASREGRSSKKQLGDIASKLKSKTRSRDVYCKDYDSDEEEEELMQKQYKRAEENRLDIPELHETRQVQDEKRRKKIREVYVRHPENPDSLLEGVMFRARYLGSTQLISDTHTTKYTRMLQAQTALQQVKEAAPDGEAQPSVEVELFVSTEKLLVLHTNLKEILMDHPLRTVSFIADIGDVVVIMARRRLISSDDYDADDVDDVEGDPGDLILSGSGDRNGSASMLSRSESNESTSTRSSTSEACSSIRRNARLNVPKMRAKVVCHVIECDDAQLVAQSIGQAFQVAYLEFLKANGIEEPTSPTDDVDYQEVLNSQEMFNEELRFFTSTDHQKDVLLPKAKGEPLGVVIVESGWGSVIPTVILANMHPRGAAARCGQLNIGDQIISVNGVSLVGLPLVTCQNYIKNARSQTSVKLRVIGCPPVVEVLVRRPDPKYQLGFSVQNGVICSLLRGGIAERGGVRVGHRIIEINRQSMVAVPHEKIVQLLSSAVGEIHMRTMPTTIYRLLTGQETPHYI